MIDTIIIPVLSRYDLLDRCIRSIRYAGTVVVIDNGGKLWDDEPRFWRLDGALSRVDEVHIIRLPTNLGVASSWNLGIKATPFSDGWLFLNADAWFEPGAYDEFAKDCRSDAVTQAGVPPWCCTHIGREVIAEVGLFCEQYHPAYMEDVDWERRARILGVDFISSLAAVGHDNSSTIKDDAALFERNAETHKANLELYHDRWARPDERGVPVDLEWSLDRRMMNAWES